MRLPSKSHHSSQEDMPDIICVVRNARALLATNWPHFHEYSCIHFEAARRVILYYKGIMGCSVLSFEVKLVTAARPRMQVGRNNGLAEARACHAAADGIRIMDDAMSNPARLRSAGVFAPRPSSMARARV